MEGIEGDEEAILEKKKEVLVRPTHPPTHPPMSLFQQLIPTDSFPPTHPPTHYPPTHPLTYVSLPATHSTHHLAHSSSFHPPPSHPPNPIPIAHRSPFKPPPSHPPTLSQNRRNKKPRVCSTASLAVRTRRASSRKSSPSSPTSALPSTGTLVSLPTHPPTHPLSLPLLRDLVHPSPTHLSYPPTHPLLPSPKHPPTYSRANVLTFHLPTFFFLSLTHPPTPYKQSPTLLPLPARTASPTTLLFLLLPLPPSSPASQKKT